MVRDHGADAAATTNDGRTPLSIAERKDYEKLDPKLGEPSDARAPASGPYTSHAEAAITLKMSVALEDAKKNSGWTALHQAAFDGDYKLVELICPRGAPSHARAFDGRTPLHLAACGGRAACGVLRLLCNAFGADEHVNERDNDGRTPLYYADAAWGHHEASRALVRDDSRRGGPFWPLGYV